MATRKEETIAKETPSKGTGLASKYRARANKLSDGERQQLRARAMSLIYGNPSGDAITTRSR